MYKTSTEVIQSSNSQQLSRAGRKGPFPLDTCPLHYVSVAPAELMSFTYTLVCV